MVQLWVNLPATKKMSEPKYQGIVNSQMAKYPLSDNSGIVEVIAGEYKGFKGSASTFSPIHLLNVHLNKGGKAEFDFPEDYNTALLMIEGSVKVNNADEVPTDYLALMENAGRHFEIEATENAIILVLSGKPLNEPIAARGPFVMNTQEELAQAFEDFYAGKFGYLEE